MSVAKITLLSPVLSGAGTVLAGISVRFFNRPAACAPAKPLDDSATALRPVGLRLRVDVPAKRISFRDRLVARLWRSSR